MSDPVADFSASQTSINTGQSINFTDLSAGNPTSWQWTFQGGTPSTSTQQNPSGIVYNSSGTYDVTLTATNAAGTDAITKSGYISVTQDTSSSGCGGITNITDPRDGQTYAVVQIGNQCWFAENLNYATGNSWCYDNNISNCNTYGRLYDWQTALNACPSGWHLPTDAEWQVLVDHLGGDAVAGGAMKSTTGWNAPNTGATNSSGFTALPGGLRNPNGSFLDVGDYGVFWSASEGSSNLAWYRGLDYNYSGVTRYDFYKELGFSCRCVRD